MAPTRTATSNTGSEHVSCGADDPSGTAQAFTQTGRLLFSPWQQERVEDVVVFTVASQTALAFSTWSCLPPCVQRWYCTKTPYPDYAWAILLYIQIYIYFTFFLFLPNISLTNVLWYSILLHHSTYYIFSRWSHTTWIIIKRIKKGLLWVVYCWTKSEVVDYSLMLRSSLLNIG